MFRLRFGEAAGADYGLLAPAPGPLPMTVAATEDGFTLESGDLRLELAQEPLNFVLSRGDRVLARSATDGHFTRRFRLPPFGRSPDGWVASLDLRSGEPIYGLGEKWGALNRRGQLVVSRNEDALGVNAEVSYKNAPFAWSPEGWGVLVHTPATVTHGVGFAPWSHRAYVVEVADAVMDLFLIAAETPAALLERYRALTGSAPAVPRWSLGVWISRAYYKTAEEAMAVAIEIRDRQIPCDVLTLDGRAWLVVDTRFGFDWDASRYPDPKAFTSAVKALGFRICAWEYPLVSVKNPLFAELAAKGWLLKDRNGEAYRYQWDMSPFGKVLTPLPESGIVDFTHPDAAAWFAESHGKLFDSGLDVMKTDFGEQVPDDAVAHNGDSGQRLHNVYPLLYNRCTYEATRRRFGDDGLVLGALGVDRQPDLPHAMGRRPAGRLGGPRCQHSRWPVLGTVGRSLLRPRHRRLLRRSARPRTLCPLGPGRRAVVAYPPARDRPARALALRRGGRAHRPPLAGISLPPASVPRGGGGRGRCQGPAADAGHGAGLPRRPCGLGFRYPVHAGPVAAGRPGTAAGRTGFPCICRAAAGTTSRTKRRSRAAASHDLMLPLERAALFARDGAVVPLGPHRPSIPASWPAATRSRKDAFSGGVRHDFGRSHDEFRACRRFLFAGNRRAGSSPALPDRRHPAYSRLLRWRPLPRSPTPWC